MGNNYFRFKQFTITQERSAFKVGTDGVLLGAVAEVQEKRRILDIGTGTGLLALMLAQKCDADIFAIESDPESFLEARENINKSKWAGRIKIENYTLQDYNPGITFDLIVTNPPYFIDSLKSPDPARSAARHDVILGNDDILTAAERLLEPDGLLQIILPYDRGNIFIADAGQHNLYCRSILKIKSTPSSVIRRMILVFSRVKSKPAERFLTIEKGIRYAFTDEYIGLTKEFYMKF